MKAEEFLTTKGIETGGIKLSSESGRMYSISELLEEFKSEMVIKTVITPMQIIQAACLYFSISEKIVTGPWKTEEVVGPRFMIMLYLHNAGYKMAHIARLFNKKDHTSVGYSIRQIQQQMVMSEEKKALFIGLEKYLSPYIN